MIVVYQGETGGTVTFELPSGLVGVAVSGYATVVSSARNKTIIGGLVSGEYLVLRKSLLSVITPGQHIILPQVVDTSASVYFIEQDDLRIIGVP